MKNYKRIWYILSSIFFALILFVYATSTNYQNNSNVRQNRSETYTNTITNVPIDVKYDSDEYFISGFSSEVSVSLTGSNRVTLASEMQESTRKFKIVADLTNVKIGISEVKLSINNLPSGLTATVNPDKITVKVGKRVSKSVSVQTTITESQVAQGIQISNISFGDSKVTVFSDEDYMERIDHVEAVLPESDVISGHYTAVATLKAVDSNGTVIPSVISPYETTVKITTKTASSSSSSTSSSSTNYSSSH
ncbi:YbbR-like protein [Streptococcus sp. oral taxon 056 str. F0418]|uniref:CdaR family protein n=1 Tax=Streptococcus sp. oral taxon 056 TaxID=712620 RepID=UPI000218129B|nr:CdaR family protein [Streptococcus sp. oral taxon 056]EGP66341.1 YbbR-like protein [Streptococcus sp. oral taxon 056 str. F0418]